MTARLIFAFCLCFSLAHAQTPVQAPVQADSVWVRATVTGQQATGVFMRLTASRDLKLVAAQSPSAAIVELHTMSMQGHVMQMRPVPSIDLPANTTVELKPQGLHVMLINLKQAVEVGTSVPVTLLFEDADKKKSQLTLQAVARPLSEH